jgi:hypothetical protein
MLLRGATTTTTTTKLYLPDSHFGSSNLFACAPRSRVFPLVQILLLDLATLVVALLISTGGVD